MAINANDAVNIPSTSTGPKTEAGKARSSRNSLKFGLFTAHDFIREGEEEEYADTFTSLISELTPENSVEETFVLEIMGATWRLRRCRLVEEAFSYIDDLDCDPMVDERTEKQQKSVDRARAQSHLILRRSLDELRKLQKGRTIQEQLADQKPTPKPTPNAGMPDMGALMAMADAQLAQRFREQGLNSFCNPAPPPPPTTPPAASSFCKPVGQVPDLPSTKPAAPKMMPRNAPCPCGSGAKYKRCHGKDAPPVLNQAA